MTEYLDQAIAKKFHGYSDNELIRRIENAPEFEYDDEQYELNRRLGERALTWMWDGDKVRVVEKAGDRE